MVAASFLVLKHGDAIENEDGHFSLLLGEGREDQEERYMGY